MKKQWSIKFRRGIAARQISYSRLLAALALGACGLAFAQDQSEDKKDETTYRLPVPTTSSTITPAEGTLYFWPATVWVRKAMFACPLAQVLPGRSTMLDPKLRFLRMFSGRRFRSSPISSVPLKTQTRSARSRRGSAT
jgi:hypothetical protein